MTKETITKKGDKLGFMNILILFLSFYVLIALLAETFFHLPPEETKLLEYIDILICGIFFIDFSIRFYHAESKLEFMMWGWIDLISCIPTIQYLRGFRVFRLIKLIRILRVFRSTKRLVDHVFRNKAEGTLTTAAIISVLMLVFSSIAILQVEDAPKSTIKTAEDAIWWSFVTLTSLGYRDRIPVTNEGRLIAVVMMTTGAGLFGTFTAFMANLFMKDSKKEKTKKEEEQEAKEA